MAKKEEKRENAARKKAAFSLRRSGVSRRLRARRGPRKEMSGSGKVGFCWKVFEEIGENGELRIENGEWRRRGRVLLPAAGGSWECGRPRRAAPTGIIGRDSRSGRAGGNGAPPLRGGGGSREPTESVFAAVWRRGGTEPAPYTMVEGMRFFRKGPRMPRER